MLLLENTKKTKFNKKTIFKTTTALTSLIGAVLLFNQTANATPTVSTGTMTVTTSVTAVCSVSATGLAFAAFANDSNTADSTVGGGVVSTNCSVALPHVLKVTETSLALGVYEMATGAGGANQTITFLLNTQAANAGTVLSAAVAFATATGTGSSVAVSTIFGQIQSGNTGKESGAYTKSIALSVTYGT
jgi:hypothetical protein